MAKHTLRDYFLPHAKNNYRPHILHPKRAVLYSTLAVVVKVIVVVFAVSVPSQAYLLPDILAAEAQNITTLTNAARANKGMTPLKTVLMLTDSANRRASDMASNQYFSHSGVKGHTLQYFLQTVSYPYRVAGENLAVGFSDAESIVNAWIKSPSHYANLVDGDFSELGIGLSAGYYQGQPTVYVAQHFGDPVNKKNSGATLNSDTAQAGSHSTPLVLGTKITAAPESVFIDDTSRVYWQDAGPRTTRLQMIAKIKGDVKKAVVEIQNYTVTLKPVENRPGEYRGDLLVYESSDNLFKNLILPTLTIDTKKGESVRATIDWYNPKIVAPTNLEKYIRAKNLLDPITSIFSVTRAFYLGMIFFFSAALLVSIFVEFKKQHYFSIVQTGLMIGLVIILWWV